MTIDNGEHVISVNLSHSFALLTPIVALQMVSMGRVMKEVMVSATVRWNTR